MNLPATVTGLFSGGSWKGREGGGGSDTLGGFAMHTVNAVQNGLKVVAFPRVFGVKKVQQLDQELGIDVLLDHLRVGLIGDNETKQELVHVLHAKRG